MQRVSWNWAGAEKVIEYTNSQMNELIDEHIHNARNRAILRLRYIDGMTYENIAANMELSTQQVKKIVYKSQEKLLKHLV